MSRGWDIALALATAASTTTPGLGQSLTSGSVSESPRPPFNVLVVLVDDVGIELLETYDAINAWPGTRSETLASGLYPEMPRLRDFAKHGITFTNAHAMPNCSPTRAGIYCGRYNMRTGVGSLVRENNASNTFVEFGVDVGLPSDQGYRNRREYVISEMAAHVGYKSAVFGKWHLGMIGVDPSIPQERGTNEVASGTLPNGIRYEGSGWRHLDQVGRWDEWFVVFNSIPNNPQPYTVDLKPDGTFGVRHAPRREDRVRNGGWYGRAKGDLGTTLFNGSRQYTDRVCVDRALDWMNASGTEPFLCFLPFSLIHTPYHDPRDAGYSVRPVYAELIDKVPPELSVWGYHMAMLEALDFEFGRLLDRLDASVRARTLIVFTSDNGTQSTLRAAREVHGKELGPTYDAIVDGANPSFKGSLYETGTRVPLIVQGPPGIVLGAPRSTPVLVDTHVDIFETCRALMHVPYEQVATDGRLRDGVSFLEALHSPDLAFGQHARQFGFSHRFQNNGDGDDPTARDGQDAWAYMRILPEDGAYKLISQSSGFELYRILSDEGSPVGADPFEQEPIDIESTGRVQFHRLLLEAQALLSTEFLSP